MGMEYGFMGPNYSISTACATANYCFVAAANHIRRGDADVILAGGSEAPIIPVGLGGFVACRYQYPYVLILRSSRGQPIYIYIACCCCAGHYQHVMKIAKQLPGLGM